MSTKQRLFLTAEMCLGMGSIMSLIGNLFAMGWTTSAFHAFFGWWVQTIVVAFIYNLMVASNITNWLISRATVGLTGQALLKKSSQIRGWTMIVIMCFSMCTWGLLTAGQLPTDNLGAFVYFSLYRAWNFGKALGYAHHVKSGARLKIN